MSESSEMVETAKRECAAHGVRLTEKRVSLLSILMQQNKAISAYELIDAYKQTFNGRVPIMTVYRALNSLRQGGLVHKLDTVNKFVVCKHIGCNDSHLASQFLICSQCLSVEEISLSRATIKELRLNIEQAGFFPGNLKLEMNCVCKGCHNETD